MNRKEFIKSGSIAATDLVLSKKNFLINANDLISKRPPLAERKFTSKAVKALIGDIDSMWLRDSSAQIWPYLLLIDNKTAS